MDYPIKKFDSLLESGILSKTLFENHLGLYEGYVNNVNKLVGLLDVKEIGTPEYSELQRRLGWEWNGMRLHELYFENLSSDQESLADSGLLKKEIERIYGSLENWKKNFAAVGMMRGIGWVVLYYDQSSKELFNVWINEHDGGHLAGATPLLVMDVFEHAYFLDYQTKRAGYIDVFMEHINWNAIEERFKKALLV